jgi:hypothetical protein
VLREVLDHVLEAQDTRRIFFFCLLNTTFMFAEVGVGLWTNSLGLLSDAGHMLFDRWECVVSCVTSCRRAALGATAQPGRPPSHRVLSHDARPPTASSNGSLLTALF